MSDIWFALMSCLSILAFANLLGVRRLVVGGIFLALAAYFREVGESSVYVAMLITSVVGIFYFFKNRSLTNSFFKVKSMLIVLMTYGTLTGPWRLMRWINIHSLSWSSSDRVLWAHVWMSNKYLKIVGGGWVSADGGNWGCDLNRRVCDQITSAQLAKIHPFDTSNIETINLFRRNAVEQLMIHPFKFLENRSYYYFKSLFLGIDLQAQWLAPRNILAISSLLILLVCLARLVIQLPKSDPIKVVAFSLLFGPLASTLLAHFETRYVWTLFITATFVPLFVSLEKTEQKRVENSET